MLAQQVIVGTLFYFRNKIRPTHVPKDKGGLPPAACSVVLADVIVLLRTGKSNKIDVIPAQFIADFYSILYEQFQEIFFIGFNPIYFS